MRINKKLLGGTLILLLTFNIFNIFNFLYQFGMARLLTIVEYGILSSLYSILYIIAIFTESIQIVVTKYSSSEEEKGKLKNLFKRSLKKAFKSSFFFLTLYLLIALPLSPLLKIPYSLMAFNGLMIFAFFLLPVSRGIMQGTKMFKSLGISMIIESLIKLVLAVSFVLLGWKIYGALLGPILGASIAFLLSFPMLKKILKAKEKKAETAQIYSYTAPVFFTIFAVLVFFSLDIIIAKIVFSPEIAGQYAIASVISKIIFMGTQPISKAMFPLSAESKKDENPDDKSKSSENIFKNAFTTLSFALVACLLILYFFPELLVKIFAGRIIPESAGILFLLGLSASLLSLTNLVLLHKLSLGKTKSYLLLPIFLVIEAFLLFYFSKSLFQFSMALVTASATFLWGSLLLLKE